MELENGKVGRVTFATRCLFVYQSVLASRTGFVAGILFASAHTRVEKKPIARITFPPLGVIGPGYVTI